MYFSCWVQMTWKPVIQSSNKLKLDIITRGASTSDSILNGTTKLCRKRCYVISDWKWMLPFTFGAQVASWIRARVCVWFWCASVLSSRANVFPAQKWCVRCRNAQKWACRFSRCNEKHDVVWMLTSKINRLVFMLKLFGICNCVVFGQISHMLNYDFSFAH